MLTRRSALKSAFATFAVPTVPLAVAVKSGMTVANTDSHSQARKAFEEYLDAYRDFFSVQYEELTDDVPYDEQNAYYQERGEACERWVEARKALVRLLLEANGIEPEKGKAPATICAACVDLGDVLLVLGGQSDYEGAVTSAHMACMNFFVVPRTPEMKRRLESLPLWVDGDDAIEWREARWYKTFLTPVPDLPDWEPETL